MRLFQVWDMLNIKKKNYFFLVLKIYIGIKASYL